MRAKGSYAFVEGVVERTSVLRAETNGWLVRKLQWVGRRNAPDRLFVKKGRVVFVEFKRPAKAVERETQDREIVRLRDAGVEVYKISTIEQADAIFD